MIRAVIIFALMVVTVGANYDDLTFDGVIGRVDHINLFYTERIWIDHGEVTDGIQEVHTGTAMFSDEKIVIQYQLKHREAKTKIIFEVDSLYISMYNEWQQVILWITPGNDPDYEYPDKIVLYYDDEKWASYLYLDRIILYFDGQLAMSP